MPLAWSGLAAGSEARDPGEAVGPDAGSGPVAGTEAPDLTDGIGPSPCSDVVPGGFAARLQAPRVSVSLRSCVVLLRIVATIPRNVRGNSPQSLGLPGFNALDMSRTTVGQHTGGEDARHRCHYQLGSMTAAYDMRAMMQSANCLCQTARLYHSNTASLNVALSARNTADASHQIHKRGHKSATTDQHSEVVPLHDPPEEDTGTVERRWEVCGVFTTGSPTGAGFGNEGCKCPCQHPAVWDGALQRIVIEGEILQIGQPATPAPSCRQRSAETIATQV